MLCLLKTFLEVQYKLRNAYDNSIMKITLVKTYSEINIFNLEIEKLGLNILAS